MWNIIQCVSQGRGHLSENIPCQDKTSALVEGDTVVVALADGAGSARHAEEGAETVTSFLCSHLAQNFQVYWDESEGAVAKVNLMTALRQSLQEKAEELSCTLQSLASTLLVVALRGEDFLLAHVGDGVIGYEKDGVLSVATHPQNGEYANSTLFATSHSAEKHLRFIKGTLTGITGFVLMSDGTQQSLYHRKEGHLAPVLRKLMQLASCDPEFQNDLQQTMDQMLRKATLDDCSIILLTRDSVNPLPLPHLEGYFRAGGTLFPPQ